MWAINFPNLVNRTGSRDQRINFDYSTGSTAMVLQSVFSGELIVSAKILIRTPFNGVNTSISLGITGAPNLVFSPSDINVGVLGIYCTELVGLESNDLLIFRLSVNDSTQGSGTLVYTIL